VVLAASGVWWFGFASKAHADSATATTQNLTVSTRTLQQTVSGTGTLTPTVDEEVSFAASGTVTAVKVKEGQTVTKGQVLATITTTQADADLASAKAALATAQAQLAAAQSASTGSDEDVATIASDEAAVTVAQASVTSAQAEVDGTTLTAPVAGVVAAVGVAVGDEVSGSSSSGGSSGSSSPSSSSSGSGQSASTSTGSASSSSSSSSSSSTSGSSGSSSSAFEITGTDSWTTSIAVSATAVKNIKVGDQVQLSTTENSSFFGTVSAIGLLPSTTSGAATYPVSVKVTGTPDNLYDGVSVTAEVIYKQITDAVAVPSLAITTKGGKSTVQKVVDGKTVTTTVTTGLSEDNYTQITKGLSSGDTIQLSIATPGTGGSRSGSGSSGGSGSGGGLGGLEGTGPSGTSGGTGGFPAGGPGQQGGN
jgi:macrolide-specific efflux system membrane fusion protein